MLYYLIFELMVCCQSKLLVSYLFQNYFLLKKMKMAQTSII
ncbi:hypothetical protein EC2731150_3373 [Escherichia coli 2731150]|nr:hypothetical protein EC2762100_5011 [Escherichia coli 2762100]EMW76725.1 hypothetical protein EC2731150_3373 [Escherichia coli 2731150]